MLSFSWTLGGDPNCAIDRLALGDFAKLYRLDHMASDDNLTTALLGAWPSDEWRDLHAVLAVSGGADSVALLRAFVDAKRSAGGTGRILVAHFDHGLRPDSARDAVWLAELCRSLRLTFETGAGDIQAAVEKRGDGLEEAARAARYMFLSQTAEKHGARFVVTAHTADDQVETVLHRILRGTGIGGLSGIPSNRQLTPSVTLVRPLLCVRRREVLEYLQRVGQVYLTDPTNTDPQFTRNWLRHELLPLVRQSLNPDVDAAILRLTEQAGEAQQMIAELAQRSLHTAVAVTPGRIVIHCERLAELPPLAIRETCKLAWSAAGLPLQSMGFQKWRQLAALVSGASQNVLNLPSNVRVERRGSVIEISRLP